jgi:pimeloyl-ACP methyl ester carboxylesterase
MPEFEPAYFMKITSSLFPRALLSGAAFFIGLAAAAAEKAVTAPTQFVAGKEGRQIAYRSVGAGPVLVLCNRFRGTLDTWDPSFVDGLAAHFRVVIFDFRGIGRSTGEAPTKIMEMAEDIQHLIVGLGQEKVVLGGWSMGGMAAQVLATKQPELISHLILIGTGPAGKNEREMEPIFLEYAHKPVNDLADEYVLFFEPASGVSRRAADKSHERIAQRKKDLDTPVPPEAWPRLHQAGAEFRADLHGSRAMLKQTRLPILILHGDHDIVFPAQNWHALNREMPTAQLIVFPHTGHGPQHQFVDASVSYIETFYRTSK